jgi:hypothetical protein
VRRQSREKKLHIFKFNLRREQKKTRNFHLFSSAICEIFSFFFAHRKNSLSELRTYFSLFLFSSKKSFFALGVDNEN